MNKIEVIFLTPEQTIPITAMGESAPVIQFPVQVSLSDSVEYQGSSKVTDVAEPFLLTSRLPCLCCQLNNQFSQMLRELFMQALQKKRLAFTQVFVCAPQSEFPAMVFTIKHDFFIKQRFFTLEQGGLPYHRSTSCNFRV